MTELPGVPLVLVERFEAIKLVVIVRIVDMQLMGIDSNDWPLNIS